MPSYLSPGVYVEEVEAGSRPIEGVGTAVAAFVGLAAQGPANTPTLVTNWSQFVQIVRRLHGRLVPRPRGLRLLPQRRRRGLHRPDRRRRQPAGRPPRAAARRREGRDRAAPDGARSGPIGNDINVEVGEPSSPARASSSSPSAARGADTETYDNVTLKKGKQNVATAVKAASKLVRVEEASATAAGPGQRQVVARRRRRGEAVQVAPDDYVGNAADRTGFAGLEAIDEVTMLAAPDVMALYQQGVLDLEGLQAIQLAMLAHCELMGDRVAILDAPPGLNAQQVKEWRMDKAGYDSKYGALYWPWIKVFDPVAGQARFVPPSGHMAGIWARNDDTRGVHKAPANEVVRGAISLELQLTKAEHDQLNPVGINCIRAFPGRGIRVWGARTLSSDPAWRYLNVRRLFNYIEESVLGGTQWVVFEPNDLALWQRVKRTINAFLRPALARRRALRGDARGGLLREVRRGDEPVRGDRRAASSSSRSGSRRSSRPSS